MSKGFYITTPIFYPNAKLHMGHAYTTTVSDIIARYQRLRGKKTYFLTGSDENTQKMVDAARKEGVEPLEFLNGIVANFESVFAVLNISYDQFIRTTDQKQHWPGAQALWEKIVASGDIYKKEYQGLYCVGHEAFVTEKDLVDGVCPDHGTKPEFVKEENYFFRLSKYTAAIKEKIERDELRIVPESRKNEILSLLENGLEDISFSRPRRADWPQGLGVPVPGDASHVMYVWCDALANYVTALGFAQDEVLFNEFWPADVHVIGKDILRFHAAIWPGMLLSAGIPLPKSLLVHGFITSGGKKMSKSLGNVIDPHTLLEKYGTDAVRYYLARHISPFDDGDITYDGFHEAYNGNLVNGLGNQVARIMKLAQDYLSEPVEIPGEAKELQSSYLDALDNFHINVAADLIWEHISKVDEYIQTTQPFKLVKSAIPEEKDEGLRIINKLVVHLYTLAVHVEPFMPETSAKIYEAVRTNIMPAALFPRL